MSKLETKKDEVQKELQDKVEAFNNLEQQRNDLAQEIVALRGQLELLQELCQQEKDSKN